MKKILFVLILITASSQGAETFSGTSLIKLQEDGTNLLQINGDSAQRLYESFQRKSYRNENLSKDGVNVYVKRFEQILCAHVQDDNNKTHKYYCKLYVDSEGDIWSLLNN